MTRWLLTALAATLTTWSGAMASPGDGLPASHPQFASAVAKGQERKPIGSATEAEAYADRITAATYGDVEAEKQRPFHAVEDGDYWTVTGSRPMSLPTMSGPITIAIRRTDGTIHELAFTAAPAGWDAEILRKLAAKH